MKSYLSLIPISQKHQKKYTRMTQVCIIIAVFLVTSIFSIANEAIKMEKLRLIEKHGETRISQLGTSSTAQILYLISGLLFVLILAASILMIAGTLNSSVTQKTRFFGMLRCIGMSKKQVKRFVTLESLNWCKLSIPIGLVLGIITTWAATTSLKFFVGDEFTSMPLFGISWIGIISGILVGILSVLIASRSPANKASKVSPMLAVSNTHPYIAKHFNLKEFKKIETKLGIEHAFNSKKNLLLLSSSFALTIILVMTFSALIDLVGYVMPQSNSRPDFVVSSKDGGNSVDEHLCQTIGDIEGVTNVFGRQNSLDVQVYNTNSDSMIYADIISFGDFDVKALKEDKLLVSSSNSDKLLTGNSVFAVKDDEGTFQIGDQLIIDGTHLEVTGLLKFDPFTSSTNTDTNKSLIMSHDTFSKLTGNKNFSLILIKTVQSISKNSLDQIQNEVSSSYIFEDKRDQNTAKTYYAFVLFIYIFLMIISLISLFNIINSISMSVYAKKDQYNVMRAIGMSLKQLRKTVAAETITYTVFGGLLGCLIGMLINKFIFDCLILTHFSYAVWTIPYKQLIIILVWLLFASLTAIIIPTRGLAKSSIAKSIGE